MRASREDEKSREKIRAMTTARDLTIHLADLLRGERAALAEFLVALSQFDRERRWLELGHASLFYFLHRELGLSKAPRSTGRQPRS